MMRRIGLSLPWPGVAAQLGAFGIAGADSRLKPSMRRLHQSRSARALAIDLLCVQGQAADEIPKRADGAPVWPEGFVGSLSHTDGYAAAVVARTDACVALGIDVEPAEPLPGDAGSLVLTADEAAWVASCAVTRPEMARLVFCAKECVHKAIHPLRGAWLEFSDVGIEYDAQAGSFVPRPLTPAAGAAFSGLQAQGRVFLREGHLVVVLALFAPSAQAGG